MFNLHDFTTEILDVFINTFFFILFYFIFILFFFFWVIFINTWDFKMGDDRNVLLKHDLNFKDSKMLHIIHNTNCSIQLYF